MVIGGMGLLFSCLMRVGLRWDWLKQVSEWNSLSIVEGRLTGWVPHVGKHSERMPGWGNGSVEECRGPFDFAQGRLFTAPARFRAALFRMTNEQ
jgi:hypothetical protein